MATARKAAGLSQEEVSVRLGVRVRTVQRWESGSNEPNISSLGAYADTVGVTLPWLIGAGEATQPQLTAEALEALREQWRRNGELLERLGRLADGEQAS